MQQPRISTSDSSEQHSTDTMRARTWVGRLSISLRGRGPQASSQFPREGLLTDCWRSGGV